MASQKDLDSVMSLLGYVRTLLASGNPLPEGLRSLALNTPRVEDRRLVETLAGELESGSSLSGALERHVPGLAPMVLTLIRSGETGGDLKGAVEALLDFHHASRCLARKVHFATFYPRLVLFLAIGFVAPVLAWSAQSFQTVLVSMNVDLQSPLALLMRGRVVDALFGMPRLLLWPFQYGWIAWVAIVAALYFILLRPVGPLWTLTNRMLYALHFVGPALRNTLAANFATALGLMVKAGVPLERAVGLTTGFAADDFTRGEMEELARKLVQGLTLSEVLATQRIFPDSFAWFVALGERGRKLDECLMEAGRYYRTEAEYLLSFFSQGLEPVLLVLMGLVIGPVVVSVLFPMLRLINNVG
ncbi:MAG: type II secretion system F family protein [Candidatus Riflebacteria bacterium]|nr:type II secretion system F family protein [Candidatus Riflebacteria bacterium]